MKKILFGIFAHPDDEAFGPAATLVKEVHDGTEVHLIVLTLGQNGSNPDNLPHLGDVRMQEWREAGKLIGASSMRTLGYTDGRLNNTDHIEITSTIMDIVKEVVATRADTAIEFMSLDLNGYTGHIDHIVAARSVCLAFYRLREQGFPMSRIRLACLPREEIPELNTDFVYMQPGLTTDQIDETIDASDFSETVHQIMRCHHTQRNDYHTVVRIKGDNIARNYFVVKD